jgi:hypothetical protein
MFLYTDLTITTVLDKEVVRVLPASLNSNEVDIEV